MAKFKFNERNIAILCALVLVIVSATAAWRQYYPATPMPHSDTKNMQPGDKKEKETSTKELVPSSTPNQPTQNQTTTQQESSPQHADSKKDTSESHDATAAPYTSDTHVFTVAAGDSYTELAREAITSYAHEHQIELSSDTLLNTEVTLTNSAGSPELEIGQTVTIPNTAITQALQAAGALNTTRTTSSQPSATASDSTTTATQGDSYTSLVRANITRYIQAHAQPLTPAQRVAAETFATHAASDPYLSEGQTVIIPTTAIQQAFARATQLDTAAQADWQPYADTVAW